MNIMEFETLDFKQKGRGGRLMTKDELSITSHGKSYSKKLNLNIYLSKDIEPYKFLEVRRQTMTSIDFLVFNNNGGIKVSRNKYGQASVSCKDFVEYLINKYGAGEESFRIKISDDVSNSPDFATYQILGKARK